MSVRSVTDQLNNTNSCSTGDCSNLDARLQKVEGTNGYQDTRLQRLENAGNPLDRLLEDIRNKLGLLPDRGELGQTDQIARQALALAQSHEQPIYFHESAISGLSLRINKVEYALVLVSNETQAARREAAEARGVAVQALNLAKATSDVVVHHTREIDDLEFQVRSLESRVAKLESRDPGDLKNRVQSLEDWRVGTVAALIALQYQIAQLSRRQPIKGDKGDPGKPGINGRPGLPGKPGTNGKDGKPGTNGKPGATGRPGLNGQPGPAGQTGATGATGRTGRPGISGPPGATGQPGAAGRPGLDGQPGTAGQPGAAGRPGLDGKPGINGQPGPAGKPGATGATGATGRPGTNGQPGPAGQPGTNGKDAIVEFSTITVKKFEGCENDVPKFGNIQISVIRGTELAESLKFSQAADIEAQKCQKKGDCYAAIPEWWEVRLGSDRPQLVLLFSPEGTKKGNLPITIPHWNGEKPTSNNPPIKDYQKGSEMAVLHLADSSKLIVNAGDRQEAIRIIQRLKRNITANMLAGSRTNFTTLAKADITNQKVVCTKAAFFPKGQKSRTPSWVVEFDV